MCLNRAIMLLLFWGRRGVKVASELLLFLTAAWRLLRKSHGRRQRSQLAGQSSTGGMNGVAKVRPVGLFQIFPCAALHILAWEGGES